MNKQLLISFLVVCALVLITGLIVLYGRGYRFNLDRGKPEVTGTGLLVATSTPDGAQVFVNGHLTTATDNTINLFPGEYTVKIFKEGYFPWEKTLRVQKEVVAKAEALLLPVAPKLESITAIGIDHPVLDPSMTRIAYTVASQSARKNGVYVLDMTSRPLLTLQSASTQITDDTLDSFSTATLSWSPDGQELLATTGAGTTYLLKAASNQVPQDVTATLTTLQNTWQTEQQEKDRARVAGLKAALKTMIANNFQIRSWSPDENKILYQASASGTLPIIISPRLIGTETTPEDRNIKKGDIYVYDLKDDKNYRLSVNETALSTLVWFPDSRHVLYVQDKKAQIAELDGSNTTTIFAGPFLNGYVFPWPNGTKIVILTNLGNPSLQPNLYTISLK